MKHTISVRTVFVGVSAERAWAVLSDLGSYPRWDRREESNEPGGPLAVGMTGTFKQRARGAGTYIITAVDPGRRWASEMALPWRELGHRSRRRAHHRRRDAHEDLQRLRTDGAWCSACSLREAFAVRCPTPSPISKQRLRGGAANQRERGIEPKEPGTEKDIRDPQLGRQAAVGPIGRGALAGSATPLVCVSRRPTAMSIRRPGVRVPMRGPSTDVTRCRAISASSPGAPPNTCGAYAGEDVDIGKAWLVRFGANVSISDVTLVCAVGRHARPIAVGLSGRPVAANQPAPNSPPAARGSVRGPSPPLSRERGGRIGATPPG